MLRYGLEYHEINWKRLAGPEALSQVLFVPQLNKALGHEIDLLKCRLEPLGNGYARLTGPLLYNTYIVFLNEVAKAEQDEFLGIFTTRPDLQDPEAICWMEQWFEGKTTMQDAKNMEGYDEALQKLLNSLPIERRLAGLPPEKILARFSAEKRLAGLSPEERLAGLSPEEMDALQDLLARRRRGR